MVNKYNRWNVFKSTNSIILQANTFICLALVYSSQGRKLVSEWFNGNKVYLFYCSDDFSLLMIGLKKGTRNVSVSNEYYYCHTWGA